MLKVFEDLSQEHADFEPFREMLSDEALERADAEWLRCINDFDTLQETLSPSRPCHSAIPHQGRVEPLPDDDPE